MARHYHDPADNDRAHWWPYGVTMRKCERPECAPQPRTHYHVYYGHIDKGRGVRMFSTTRAARYESKSAAQKAAAKQQPDKRLRMVMRCDFDPEDCPSRQPIPIFERRNDR